MFSPGTAAGPGVGLPREPRAPHPGPAPSGSQPRAMVDENETYERVHKTWRTAVTATSSSEGGRGWQRGDMGGRGGAGARGAGPRSTPHHSLRDVPPLTAHNVSLPTLQHKFSVMMKADNGCHETKSSMNEVCPSLGSGVCPARPQSTLCEDSHRPYVSLL